MTTLQILTLEIPDLDHMRQINAEAFPESEQVPVEYFLDPENKVVDTFGVYEDGRFVGFIVMRKYDSCAYISFLAIDAAYRNQGIGGRALQCLPAEYPGMQMVVDFESIDCPCDNLAQRARRRAFYLRNGYHPTGMYMYYMETEFEVAYAGEGAFDREGFLHLIEDLHNAVPDFDPKIYDK